MLGEAFLFFSLVPVANVILTVSHIFDNPLNLLNPCRKDLLAMVTALLHCGH